ncbi:unnamed protein product [Dicrocoelium dendriticum]|nr:unnamed protein product [Dicrocoelium dendriticum]
MLTPRIQLQVALCHLCLCASGMSPRNCHPRFGYEAAQTMCNNYPERLGLAICIRPGAVFKAAWQMMKAFLSATTASKIRIVGSKTQLEHILQQNFSPSMVEWIISEYESNRRKPPASRYRPFWHPPLDGSSAHDPRGDKAYIENWILVKHQDGHQPHPNITDYLEGRLGTDVQVTNVWCSSDHLEDDDAPELDEVAAHQLLDSEPVECHLPTEMERLTY